MKKNVTGKLSNDLLDRMDGFELQNHLLLGDVLGEGKLVLHVLWISLILFGLLLKTLEGFLQT